MGALLIGLRGMGFMADLPLDRCPRKTVPFPTGASALDAPRKTCYTYAVTPSTSGTPSPLPSPSGGERTIEDSSSLGNVDWPVERTATRAVGQTDGVLSDINFGEVFPFVT